MHKRREGNPHKGWKASARARLRGTTSLYAPAPAFAPCEPNPKGGLCECAACAPVVTNSVAVREHPMTDEEAIAYLDTLPRAQWAHADTMLRIAHQVPKDRAVELVKTWLREKLLNVPRQFGASLAAIP